MSIEYDFFIAHAGPDEPTARALYEAMRDDARVFLASAVLESSDAFDLAIPAAQRASRRTVVLVSRHTDEAWYLRAEIAGAIRQAREPGGQHAIAVVKVTRDAQTPYGLESLHALDLETLGSVETLARTLLGLPDGGGPPPDDPITADVVDRLVEIAILRHASVRGLRSFIPPLVVAKLPDEGALFHRLRGDIMSLHAAGAARGASGPVLAIWLRNLASEVEPYPDDHAYVMAVRTAVLGWSL